jgi:hypothetical protein
MYACGLRVSEAASLEVTAIEGLNGLIRVIGKGNKERCDWVASGQNQHAQRHGECMKEAPACDRPDAVFINDKPLRQALSHDNLQPGQFYLDHSTGRLYLADDPPGRKVEVAVAAFAFESAAPNVLVRNLTVEKYASVAQKGAIHAQGATGWVIENCEVRLNCGAATGSGAPTSSLPHRRT